MPIPRKSTGFIYRVLLSLQQVQKLDGHSSGAKLKDIVKYIKTNYATDGDIVNQVETALERCVCLGFVVHSCHQYQLIVTASKIMRTAYGLKRDKEIDRIKDIFSPIIADGEDKQKDTNSVQQTDTTDCLSSSSSDEVSSSHASTLPDIKLNANKTNMEDTIRKVAKCLKKNLGNSSELAKDGIREVTEEVEICKKKSRKRKNCTR